MLNALQCILVNWWGVGAEVVWSTSHALCRTIEASGIAKQYWPQRSIKDLLKVTQNRQDSVLGKPTHIGFKRCSYILYTAQNLFPFWLSSCSALRVTLVDLHRSTTQGVGWARGYHYETNMEQILFTNIMLDQINKTKQQFYLIKPTNQPFSLIFSDGAMVFHQSATQGVD